MKHQIILRYLLFVLLFFGLCANSPLAAQQAREGDASHQALRRELIRMRKEDQKHRDAMLALMKRLAEPDNRQVMKKLVAVGEKQAAIDKKLLKRLEEIIQKYGWPTISMVGAEASEVAFLIIQHADLSYQKKYFPLLKQAAAKKEARPDHVAMMEDRMLMGEGKKQIYGTGLRTDDTTNELKLWPIENEEEVDARRAAVGLPPMAEYLKMMGLKYNPPKKNN